MSDDFDLIVIGSGPGGYVAAIRAAQLGMRTAIVESAELGGICLNWGCIPTKALLKSAEVFEYIKHSTDYGITTDVPTIDFPAMMQRSRGVSERMSNGVEYLLKKNGVHWIRGFGRVTNPGKLVVEDSDGNARQYQSANILLATGGRSRELPGVPIDRERVLGYRDALALKHLPESMTIIGSGAIGVEFAYFFNSLGTKITIVEALADIVPAEDIEISRRLDKSFRRSGMDILTEARVLSVSIAGGRCRSTIQTPAGKNEIDSEYVLSAVGVVANIEDLGLEEAGVQIRSGKIMVNEFYESNIPGIFAIGDVIEGPALAHVASTEGTICVEKIAGLAVHPLDYSNIPACTYCRPEIASVGYTEQQAKSNGLMIKVGTFPFSASGKANAAGSTDGFVKIIFDENTGELVGAHMIGNSVTELIAEVVAAKRLEATGGEILNSVHPHPTLSECVLEATAVAYEQCVNI